jgi:ribosomal protein S27AE
MTDRRCRRAERCYESEKVNQRPAVCAQCECHNGPNHPCTVPGGCGHLHKPTPTKVGGRINTDDGLCLICTRATQQAITELPRDYVDLTHALQHGTAGLAELVAATKELPAPLRVSIAALKAELVRVAATWAEPVAEKLGIDWDSQHMDRHARPGYVLQRASRILATNLPVLLALRDVEVLIWAENGLYSQLEPSDGITAAVDLLTLHQVTRAALGQTKLVHELPAPCPNCGNTTLVRDDGDDNVHCQRCRLQWPEADYKRLTLVLAADYTATPAAVKRSGLRSTAEGTISRALAQETVTR